MPRSVSAHSLALAYALYFGALGVSAPYWSLYLRDLGFSLVAIGTLTAVVIGVRILSQLGWSWLADRSGRPLLLVRYCLLVATLLIACAWPVSHQVVLVCLMIAWSVALAACLPQLESLTLNTLGKQSARYGRIRLWGSIGFIGSVIVGGRLIDAVDTSVVLVMMILIYSALTCLFFTLPATTVRTPPLKSAAPALTTTLRRVWVLLLVCLLMQASHAPFYTFFSIHLQSLNYSSEHIGYLWALGVMCEVGIFYMGVRLFTWLSPELVLVLTFVAAALRWVMLALTADSPTWVAVSQCLHGLTFGACHAAAIQLIHARFPVQTQHRGQAVYASVTYGGGTALGAWVAGHSWHNFGATTTLLGAAGVASTAAVIGGVWWWKGRDAETGGAVAH